MRPAFDWVAPVGWLLLILATAAGGATAQGGVYAPQRTGAAAWQIIGPGEILSACAQDATGLCFTDARGAPWTLRTGTGVAEVRDGEREQFWPLPVVWVREALEALDPRIPALVACRIYVLPLPRENLPRSSCDGVAIYLSPTVRPATREVVHFVVFHEVGHLLHRRLLPDGDREGWRRYRRIRGVTDEARYSASAPPPDRPHELFAEDFRLLFGTEPARGIRPAWVPSAAPPSSRPRLRRFFHDLLSTAPKDRLYAAR